MAELNKLYTIDDAIKYIRNYGLYVKIGNNINHISSDCIREISFPYISAIVGVEPETETILLEVKFNLTLDEIVIQKVDSEFRPLAELVAIGEDNINRYMEAASKAFRCIANFLEEHSCDPAQ